MVQEGLDGLLVTHLENVRYLSGYTGSNGIMLVTGKAAWFYTDFRYQEQIRTEVRGCRKRVLERSLYAAFPVDDAAGIRKLGVESQHLTLHLHRLLKRQLKGIKLVPVREDLVLALRRCKEAIEIAAIHKAQRATERTYQSVQAMIKPGVREIDLAVEITSQFARVGENAFDPIVASGPNGAKPHAGASTRKLRKGDAITFDIGARVGGYCSDMTRTVFLGRPNPDLLEVYRIVLEAQRRAIAAVRPGASCREVDRVARDHITSAGYGPYFGHSLGHGVGINVHEQPSLAWVSGQTLAVGDVVTVEPGIYLPGLGGVRIEDMVVVTKAGCDNLTRSPKQVTQL